MRSVLTCCCLCACCCSSVLQVRPGRSNAACNSHSAMDRHCAIKCNSTTMSGGGVDCSLMPWLRRAWLRCVCLRCACCPFGRRRAAAALRAHAQQLSKKVLPLETVAAHCCAMSCKLVKTRHSAPTLTVGDERRMALPPARACGASCSTPT